MSFGAVAASYLSVVDAPAPLLAVGFDEGVGETFTPTIGSGTGTVTSGLGQWVPGVHGGTALGRNASGPTEPSDICAVLSGVSSLDTSSWTGMTVMAWVYPHHWSTAIRWPVMLLDGAQPDDGWMGWELGYNTREASSWVNGVKLASSGDIIPDDGWVHLCTAWDGTTQRFYADGVEAGAAVPVAGPLYATSNIAIGSVYWNYGAQGVDDLRIYDQSLTESQIISLMAIPV